MFSFCVCVSADSAKQARGPWEPTVCSVGISGTKVRALKSLLLVKGSYSLRTFRDKASPKPSKVCMEDKKG